LFDLNNVLENYSYGLLDIRDNDRNADQSSTDIDKTYNLTNGFTFNIANYRSTADIYSSRKIDDLISGLGESLPSQPDSAIKLLVNILAKEYLISAGLGNPGNVELLNKFVFGTELGATLRTNIFDNIIGNVGDNIFQLPQGRPNSLARILYIEDTNLPPGNLILPFENRYITNPPRPGVTTPREVNTYIPGTSYFSDAIVKTDTKQWNVKPYTDFVAHYSEIVNNVKTAIYRLLNLDALSSNWFLSTGTTTGTPTSLLSPVDLFRYFVYGLQTSFNSITTREQNALNEIGRRQLELNELYQRFRTEVAEGAVGLDGVRARVSELQPRLREINADLEQFRPSSIQAFILALFTEAASNPELKKVLFKICLLRGIYKNLLSRSDFFDKLTIYDIDNINKITGIGNAITNSTNSGFNIGTLDSAIDRYIENNTSTALLSALGLLDTAMGTVSGRSEARETIASIDGNEINLSTINISERNELVNLLKTIVKNGGAEGGRWRFNLIEQCNVVAAKLLSSTKQGDGIVQALFNDSSITRFNGIDLITQYAFIFETFVHMAKKYSGVSFGGAVRSPTVPSAEDIEAVARGESRRLIVVTLINVRIDINKQEAFHKSADEFKKVEPALSASPPPSLHSALFVYNDLYSIYSKLKKELDYVRYAIAIFEVIGQRLQDTSTTVRNFFNTNSLAAFLNRNPITNINIIRYPSQVRLSNFIYNNIKEKYTYADSLVTLPGGVGRAQISNIREKLVVSDAILPSEFNALVSCFSFDHPDFKTLATNIDYYDDPVFRNNRIVTVGIPAGFSKKLADRVTRDVFNRQGANAKQSDVIEVRIHPVDLRYADIVLKPITYLFDLSLFVGKKNMYDLDAKSGENFNRLLERLRVTDLENVNSIQSLTQASLLNDSRYAFLSEAQKRNLFLNTFRSYLFEVYINCLNGMKMSEEVFLASGGRKTLNSETRDILNRYLGSINERVIPRSYTTTEDILSSPGYTQTVKDAYRLFTYGSLVFNEQELTRRVMTPKYFDRVFHLGVDLSRLEIDILKTRINLLTIEGAGVREGIDRARDGGHLVEVGSGTSERKFLKTTDINDFIIKSIYMNVVTTDTGTGGETVISTESGTGRVTETQVLGAARESRAPSVGGAPLGVDPGRFR
jgi:hypothetical protein